MEDKGKKNKVGLYKFLLFRGVLSNSLGLAFLLLIVLCMLRENILNGYSGKMDSMLDVFVDSIVNSFLIGDHYDVKRSCKNYLTNNQDILSIQILDSANYAICNYSTGHEELNAIQNRRLIYFDEDKKNIAGSIDVTYSTSFLNQAFFNAYSISILLFFSSFIFQALFLRKQIKRVSIPIENLSASLESGDLDKIFLASNKSNFNIAEVSTLFDGSKNLVFKIKESSEKLKFQTHLKASVMVAKMLAHDCKNIASYSYNGMERLRNCDPNKRDTIIDQIDSEVQFSYFRIKEMLAQIIDSTNKAEFSLVNLNEIVDILLIKYKSFNPEIKFSFSASDPSLSFYGDKMKLLRLVENLLKNAVEAAKGERKVWVKISDLHAESVVLTVGNSGARITYLHDEIFQFGVSTKSEKSRGIGLASSKQIVLQHGGSIDFKNLENKKGVEFCCILPKDCRFLVD